MPRAVSELKRGGADAVVGDFPVVVHAARESMGTMEVVGTQFETGLFGIGVAKTAADLRLALIAALRKVMDDGKYMDILRNWGIHVGKVDPPVDPPTVPGVEAIPQLQDGKLHVGTELAFAPMEFYDEMKRPAGADVELANALGEALGVEVELVPMGFDSLLDALESGQVDAVISSMTITTERQQRADFIEYFEAGSGILVTLGNPEKISRPEDLCGKKVAVQQGTSQIELIKDLPCR
jgi:ABC-type amino acid transport substrate-binding protein